LAKLCAARMGAREHGTKESAVKAALRRAQWTLYALAPVLLVFAHSMGKRW
jgi:hypothetical protein